MRLLPTLALTLALANPALAQTLLSEASGNWAGTSGEGFTFLARLTQNQDMARLTIWGGGPGASRWRRWSMPSPSSISITM